MAKKQKKSNIKESKTSTSHISEEILSYRNKMSFVWIALAISWISILILGMLYGNIIISKIKEHKYIGIIYATIYLLWSMYRTASRAEIKNSPNFQEKFNTDLKFVKDFNNRELRYTFFSYSLIAIPIIFMSDIFTPILVYFDINPNELSALIVKAFLSLITWLLQNLISAIFGGLAYDYVKRKFFKKIEN